MLSFRQIVAGSLFLTAATLACPAQLFAQHPWTGVESAARAVQLTGQVSVIRDNTPWALHQGSYVNARQIIVTGADGFAIFEVSDGSTFEVYPNSRVTFRANSGNWKDLVDVWLGRIKVHIEKLGGAPNPNKVRTPTAVISVRGTTFDVTVEDDESTLVSVDEGLVDVQHALLPSREPKHLGQGDSVRVYRDQPLARTAPNRDAFVQRAKAAAEEALYRVIFSRGAGGSGIPAGGAPGGQPLPGDTGSTKNPPPPPAPPGSADNP